MYHIKENGKLLCEKKLTKSDVFISMTAASRTTFTQCCPICQKRYMELLNKMVFLTIKKDENNL
jgi:hypothetical protein